MSQSDLDAAPAVQLDPETQFSLSRLQLIYATWLLAVVGMFNTLDRSGLSILVQPIKVELELTDTQIGLLSGFAFSLTYAAFGIPLARIADTRNRIKLLALCLAVWSLATALAGTVTSFIQLALTRVFVGVGEAGGSPASMSLLSDYYPPQTRARGIGWWLIGTALGSTLGLAAVGYIADQFGWRVAFFTMGIPGVVVAILAFLTIKEPPRGRFQEATQTFDTSINWRQAIAEVLSRWTMRHMLAAWAIVAFGATGFSAWLGVFFMRSHGLTLTEVGSLLAIVLGLGSLAGTSIGLVFAPRLVSRDRRWELWWPAVAYSTMVPGYLVSLYLDSTLLACAVLAVTTAMSGSANGLLLSAIQSVLPAHVRAVGYSLTAAASSFIGAGLGPLFVGVFSDALSPRLGDDGLRYALMIVTVTSIWGIVHLFFAAKHFRKDLVS